MPVGEKPLGMVDGSERVVYSAAPDRPPLRWPGGARVALWVAPNIEHYEFLPEKIRGRDPWPRMPHPDILGYGLRNYGNRVGVWRLMELFDRYPLPITVSLSMAVLQMYPDITEAMMQRDWEFMSHGLYNTRYHWGLDEDAKRSAIAECQQIHRAVTGRAEWLVLAGSLEHIAHARPGGGGGYGLSVRSVPRRPADADPGANRLAGFAAVFDGDQ
jgi:allantoinase